MSGAPQHQVRNKHTYLWTSDDMDWIVTLGWLDREDRRRTFETATSTQVHLDYSFLIPFGIRRKAQIDTYMVLQPRTIFRTIPCHFHFSHKYAPGAVFPLPEEVRSFPLY